MPQCMCEKRDEGIAVSDQNKEHFHAEELLYYLLFFKTFLDVFVVHVLVSNYRRLHVKLFHNNRSAHSVTAYCVFQPVVCCCVGVG